ncbi:hypothetical protein [Helicobacter sp. 23-1045]
MLLSIFTLFFMPPPPTPPPMKNALDSACAKLARQNMVRIASLSLFRGDRGGGF